MKTQLLSRVLAALVAMSVPAAFAADLNALDVASLPGGKVELKLTFDEPVDLRAAIPSSNRHA